MLGRASELVLGGRAMLREPQHAQDAGGEDVEGAAREGGVLNVCVVLHVLYLSGGGGGVLRGKRRLARIVFGPSSSNPVTPTKAFRCLLEWHIERLFHSWRGWSHGGGLC